MDRKTTALTRRALVASAALAAGAASSSASAQGPTPAPTLAAGADQGDARAAGDFMQGFPPAADARVNETNWQTWPQAKWSVRHMREVFSSRDATPRALSPAALPEAARSFAACAWRPNKAR